MSIKKQLVYCALSLDHLQMSIICAHAYKCVHICIYGYICVYLVNKLYVDGYIYIYDGGLALCLTD